MSDSDDMVYLVVSVAGAVLLLVTVAMVLSLAM